MQSTLSYNLEYFIQYVSQWMQITKNDDIFF